MSELGEGFVPTHTEITALQTFSPVIENPDVFQQAMVKAVTTHAADVEIGHAQLRDNNVMRSVNTSFGVDNVNHSYRFTTFIHFQEAIKERTDRGYYNAARRAELTRQLQALNYNVSEVVAIDQVTEVPQYTLQMEKDGQLLLINVGYGSAQEHKEQMAKQFEVKKRFPTQRQMRKLMDDTLTKNTMSLTSNPIPLSEQANPTQMTTELQNHARFSQDAMIAIMQEARGEFPTDATLVFKPSTQPLPILSNEQI